MFACGFALAALMLHVVHSGLLGCLRSVSFQGTAICLCHLQPVPHALQPAFTSARTYILDRLHTSYAAGEFEGTMVGELVAGAKVSPRTVPNLMLAALWASMVCSPHFIPSNPCKASICCSLV